MARIDRDVRIPLRDGRWLAADLYRPEGSGARPAILIQTPYGKKKLGAALPHPSARSWLDFWDRERYALVIADWRGFNGSREAGDGRPALHRGEDGVDLARWVAAQPWCDGRIGGWGPSALGRAILRTAVEKPALLVCGVPLVCAMGHHYSDIYEGGVLKEAHVSAVGRLGFDMSDRLRAEPLDGTDFYRRGEEEDRPEDLDLPLLIITGWFDLVVDRTLAMFRRIRADAGPRARAGTRILVGPWHHTAVDQRRQGGLEFPGAVGEAAEVTRRFLDHWLGGARGTGRDEPPVRYWQMGEERWIASPSWPPPGLSSRILNLGADGTLSEAPPEEAARSFRSDPENPVPTAGGANLPFGLTVGPRDQREVEEREDVLVYTTDPLPEPVRLSGGASVTLTASTDAVDEDLAVRLTDVHEDGRSMLVSDSIARAKLRVSPAKPVLLTPWERFEVTVRLPSAALTFLPGHRIRISISGTNWPRFERNAHTGEDHYHPAQGEPAKTTLHHGGDARSFLTLPIREGAELPDELSPRSATPPPPSQG